MHLPTELTKSLIALDIQMLEHLEDVLDVALSGSEARIMAILNDPEVITIKQIAHKQEVSKQASQRTVGTLVEMGILYFETPPKDVDQRQKYVRRTALGLSISEEIKAFHGQVEQQLSEQFGHKKMETFFAVLTQLQTKD